MTEKQDRGVVTQADIDAAQGYIDAFNRDGINSKHKLAQHFAAHRLASQADQGACPVQFATVRDGGDEWHIECRFKDGQKFAAVTVDKDQEALADWIAKALTQPSQKGEGA